MGMELHIFYRNSNKKKLPDNPLLTRTVDSELNFLWPGKDPKLFFAFKTQASNEQNLGLVLQKHTTLSLPSKKKKELATRQTYKYDGI